MEELGRIFDQAKPDVTLVITPHNVHISNALGVIVAGRIAGRLSGTSIALDVPSDMELAWNVLGSMGAAGVPSAGVGFGSNDPSTAVAPMDWGVLIPVWFMGGRHDPPVPVVVVTPARDLPAEAHVEAGRASTGAAAATAQRVALIASADHGHAHVADGPYGYHAAAGEYDSMIRDMVAGDALGRLCDIPPELVENAKADSWWQVLVLHGATGGFRGRLISYEAPTYFGMLTAVYLPVS